MQKPNVSSELINLTLMQAGLSMSQEKVVLIGMRRGALGEHVGTFDDAFVWVSQAANQVNLAASVFNGNTDPSREFPHVANLKPGVWLYGPGIHHGMSGNPPYPAYVQAGDVTVKRYVDGKNWTEDTGEFGIHIHHGGLGTSSLGCQTVPLEQWEAFKKLGDTLLAQASKKVFKYVLVEGGAV